MGFALHRTGSAHGQPSVYHHEWVWHLHGTGEQEGIGEHTGVSFIPQRTLNLELWIVKIGSSSKLEFFKALFFKTLVMKSGTRAGNNGSHTCT